MQREKHPVGRPIKQQNVSLLNEQETKKKEAIESKRPSKHDKKKQEKREYQNWFYPHLWPQILVAVKRYGNNKSTFIFLQTSYKSLGVPNPYAKLTRFQQCESGL